MVQLSKRVNENTVTRLDEIAQCEDVSANFLVQIMNDLKNAEVIQSKRGKAGGYFLEKSADDITLYDIVAAVEPAMVSKMSVQTGQSANEVAATWAEVSNRFTESLKETTLNMLSGNDNEIMFYI